MKNRKPTRMANYDYSQSGVYFVTICTRFRDNIFGNILNDGVSYSNSGQIAHNCWVDIPNHHPVVGLDEYIIMPDHVHGIVNITVIGNEQQVGNRHACSLQQPPQYQILPVVIGSFKSAVTKLIRQNWYSEFAWQKSYHDHIIRSADELNRIRKYIIENPLKWAEGEHDD